MLAEIKAKILGRRGVEITYQFMTQTKLAAIKNFLNELSEQDIQDLSEIRFINLEK